MSGTALIVLVVLFALVALAFVNYRFGILTRRRR